MSLIPLLALALVLWAAPSEATKKDTGSISACQDRIAALEVQIQALLLRIQELEAQLPPPPPATPGVQGFGAGATGGAGHPDVHVTNLNASGPGSLQEAVSLDNRRVVFDVGGDILLADYVYVQGSNITIAGATAPFPGVTLRGAGLAIHGTHTTFFACGTTCYGVRNLIVQHLRIRDAEKDGIRIAHHAEDIVLDHVSVEGSGDGDIDISESRNVTVQWSIVAKPAGDEKNMLVKYAPSRITLHHNLFIGARQRNPQVRIDDVGTLATETTADIVNNVMWDWVLGSQLWHGPWVNLVGNLYNTPADPARIPFALLVSHNARVYADGNLYLGQPGIDLDAKGTELVRFTAPQVTTQSACEAAHLVREHVGARPLDIVDIGYLNGVALPAC